MTQERTEPLSFIANSSTLEVGQPVAIIGNPFGLLSSFHTGMISGLNRLTPSHANFSIPGSIQIDGIINPGDSGGPVLSSDGKVVGLVSSLLGPISGTFAGISSAVPSNTIQKIVPELIIHGSYKHPWLGISGGPITQDIAKSAGLPRNYKGVVIASVQRFSPAEQAGLQETTRNNVSNTQKVGDIILGIDGHPVASVADILSYIENQKSAGDTIVLKVLRNGIVQNIDVKLTERPLPVS